jgi:hypothetical protein
VVGLAFAAAAGVGLAQITTGTESVLSGPPSSTSVSTSTTMSTPTTDTETDNGQPMVVICHHTGSTSNPEHTITVAEPAVQAHLANHKDALGPCPPVTTSVTTSTMKAPVTTTVSKPRHAKKPKHVSKHLSNGHSSSHTSSGHGHHSTATKHGKSGSHGNSGGSHGNSGGSHGNSGASHGNSGASHGNSGASHGNSGNGHGK